MTASIVNLRTTPPQRGESHEIGLTAMGKQFLNALEAFMTGPVRRTRYAALPMRYLEDIGLTAAERDAEMPWTAPIALRYS